MFYFLVFIAAVTSSISLLEVVCTYRIDAAIDKGKKPNRQKITCIAAGLIFVVGLPVALDALGSGGAAFPAPLRDHQLPGRRGRQDPHGHRLLARLLRYTLRGRPDVLRRAGRECPDRLGLQDQERGRSGVRAVRHKFWGYGFFNVCFKFIVPVIMAFVLYGQISDFF